MDLTWIFPQPEPVQIGARTLLACSLRLADLARLQGWLKLRRPCPLEVARPAIEAAEVGSESRRRLLRDAFTACRKWPDRLGTPEAYSAISTDEGIRFWLAVCLAEYQPDLSAEDLDELVATITVGQYEALARVVYGSVPVEELNRLITPDSYPPNEIEPTNWGKLASELIDETGWTFAQIGEVRLVQLAAFRTKGKAGSGKVQPPPGMGRFAFMKRQKQFFGPDRDEI